MIADTIPLGELTTVQTGKLDANASTENGEYPFFTCAREPLKIDRWKYDLDAVLVAGNGDLNVKHYRGKFEAYQRTYIINSLDDKRLDTRYLFHFLDKYVERLREQSIGGIIKYIKLGMLTGAEIPLPPLEEQKRIAAILDQADRLRRLRQRAIDRLNTLGQAIFYEMFGDSSEERYQVEPLDDVADTIDYGFTASATDEPIGPKLLRITDIQNGKVDWGAVPYCAATQSDVSEKRLLAGDIVFARTGATTGKSFLITTCPENSIFASYLIRVRPGKKLLPEFVASFFQTRDYWRQISLQANGAAQPGVNSTKLKKLLLPIPPLGEQEKFTESHNRIASQASLLETDLARLSALFSALQHRAFRGEL